MGVLMDLVAGNAREILLAITVDDWEGLADSRRFAAHVSLGGGLDRTWLDLFAEAARETTGDAALTSFTDACCPLDRRDVGDRTIECVDSHWIDCIALIPDNEIDALASRWIDLVQREECDVEADEKPMFRSLAAEIVTFCRRAEGAEDVLFAWSL